jgi:hypothetical protein
MINPVFVRTSDDKQVQRPDVRFEQVSDLVHVTNLGCLPTLVPGNVDVTWWQGAALMSWE